MGSQCFISCYIQSAYLIYNNVKMHVRVYGMYVCDMYTVCVYLYSTCIVYVIQYVYMYSVYVHSMCTCIQYVYVYSMCTCT